MFDRLRRRSGPDRLAAEVRAALRAAGMGEVRYDRANFAIEYRRPGHRTARMYLQNLYSECQHDPAGRAGRIARFVATFASLSDVPTSWSEAKPLLRPVLRRATFARGGPGQPTLRRPAWAFIDELVVVDQPSSMAYVVEAMCARWGVRSEEVFAAARANLTERADLDDRTDLPDGPAVLRFIDDGDAYWVSHLLLDGWLARLAEHVGGRPVAFAPDATGLLVVPDEPTRLAEVFALVREEFTEAPRSLTPVAYTVDQRGRVVPYEAPAGHALATEVGRSERTLAAYEYAAQQAVLREAEVAEQPADCGLYAGADGTAFTVTTWTQGVPALLPRTDYVGFAATGEAPFYVPWPAVAEADVVTEAWEYRPVRYHADRWPGTPALGYLRERAVPLHLRSGA